MGFFLDACVKRSQERAEQTVLAQCGGDESVKALLLAQHTVKEISLFVEELRNAGDIERANRSERLLKEATQNCRRLLAEWQPTEKQRRWPQ